MSRLCNSSQINPIMESPKLKIVMFPWFAFGHISPFIQLSNKLSARGCHISFFSAPANIPRITSLLNTSLPHVQIIPVKIPPTEGLPVGLESTAELTPLMHELLKKALDEMQPQIRSLLSDIKPHFVIHDFCHHWLPSMAEQLGIKSLYFSAYSVIALALCVSPARIKQTGETPTLEEMKKPPRDFPKKFSKTLKTYQAENCLYLFKSFYGLPTAFDRIVSSMSSCTAIVVKSCKEIEGPYIDYLKTKFDKPVLPLGPLLPDPPTQPLEEKWATWLDNFPRKSVIFCSFGSETFLEDGQIYEIVLGLELTGLPFFVALNFVREEDYCLESALPDGFKERVKGRGLVHKGWVQQQQILAHESVGCFLCHAGFSSITEALMNDCQLVFLPIKADQFLNARLVGEDMEAGVEVNRRDEDGHFTSKDVCVAINTVMMDADQEPGKTIRANNEKWKNFMLNKEMHEGFITEFVNDLKKMALINWL